MPVTLTYPGVYIEEVPSGVRTIVGVATSVAAFVGSAPRGPANDPVSISSFGDFETTFGGLSEAHPMSYAVQDFYLNGGGQAVIVRVNGAEAAPATIPADNLSFQALSEGTWGNSLKVRIERPDPADTFSDSIAKQLNPGLATPLTKNDLFHLILWDTVTGTIERFDNLTVKESSRRADRIVQTQSKLARLTTALPGVPGTPATPPTPGSPGNPATPGTPAIPATDVPPAANATTFAAGKTALTDDTTANVWYKATENSGVDGVALVDADYGVESNSTGIYALEQTDLFNLLVLPPPSIGADTPPAVWTRAVQYCIKRRALLLLDPPVAWTDAAAARDNLGTLFDAVGTEGAKHSAVYFPFLNRKDKFGILKQFVPSGAVAGVIARIDSQRGVWKAPAGLEAGLVGAESLSVNLTPDEQGRLNPIGINCLRVLPGAGRVVYGARTLAGNDLLASEWKYVPVRRLALFIEETLFRGTQWVVFEPNDEPLWAQIRANVGAFLHTLFRQGAFEGGSPQDAYYVRCDNKTTTPDDRNRGVVNIEVGFKPLKPAEFVVIKIKQIADQAG